MTDEEKRRQWMEMTSELKSVFGDDRVFRKNATNVADQLLAGVTPSPLKVKLLYTKRATVPGWGRMFRRLVITIDKNSSRCYQIGQIAISMRMYTKDRATRYGEPSVADHLAAMIYAFSIASWLNQDIRDGFIYICYGPDGVALKTLALWWQTRLLLLQLLMDDQDAVLKISESGTSLEELRNAVTDDCLHTIPTFLRERKRMRPILARLCDQYNVPLPQKEIPASRK